MLKRPHGKRESLRLYEEMEKMKRRREMARERGPEEQRGYLGIPADPSHQYHQDAKVSHLECYSPVKAQPAIQGAEELPSKTSQSIEL